MNEIMIAIDYDGVEGRSRSAGHTSNSDERNNIGHPTLFMVANARTNLNCLNVEVHVSNHTSAFPRW